MGLGFDLRGGGGVVGVSTVGGFGGRLVWFGVVGTGGVVVAATPVCLVAILVVVIFLVLVFLGAPICGS